MQQCYLQGPLSAREDLEQGRRAVRDPGESVQEWLGPSQPGSAKAQGQGSI